ncbi:MAG: hypothetical protein JJU31_11725 [Wenzhouxiangella sp.]|nr:hypothetical protein [Wenzhouxiangella sp.]
MSASFPLPNEQLLPAGRQLPLSQGLRARLAEQLDGLIRAARLQARRSNPSLCADTAVELAGFLAACDHYEGGSTHQPAVEVLLAHAREELMRRRPSLDGLGRWAGITHAFNRVALRTGATPLDFVPDIDQALLKSLEARHWEEGHDLVQGLVGFGLYALGHASPVWRRRLLGLVLLHLERLAERTPDGWCWRTAARLLDDDQRRRYPNGCHFLGLAAGQAGVIGLLARAMTEDVHADKAAAMLEPAVAWLLAQRRAADAAGFHFPTLSEDPYVSRPLSWRKGDFGIACALFHAAWATGRPDWYGTAWVIARDCARLRGIRASIHDPGLRDGSAGAALIFQRIWQHSDNPELASASMHWLEQSLTMRDVEFEEAAGIFALEATRDSLLRMPSLGLLTGLAGVGMSYLTALGNDDPDWDAPLLTSLPPASGTRI